jgi:hypothetical protein
MLSQVEAVGNLSILCEIYGNTLHCCAHRDWNYKDGLSLFPPSREHFKASAECNGQRIKIGGPSSPFPLSTK